ncbi:hypothetical protein PYW07_017472 [Mythimna separata]|uniref:Beta-1,4-N-acetylgalactosaminyltransferase n=1 Tax=Mythimna separata TaxID=271217 RepID=A0AAD7YY03_MYTSE|nr:hypothetical protein PYW07_017472 [Mythimna separata]
MLNAIKKTNITRRSLLKVRIPLRVIPFILIIVTYNLVPHFLKIYMRYNFPHLPVELLETELYKQRSPKLVLHKHKPDCKYDEVLKNTRYLSPSDVPKEIVNFSEKGIFRGDYVPQHCNPIFSVAIIVIYRDRKKQLDLFLPYMHNFLRKQNIHYRIYLVEQQGKNPFNRGLLLNVGARQAIEDQFPCLILHDVDLLPLDAANLYACASAPRHMSASIDKFEYLLPYDYLTGGVLAIRAEDFVTVNGYSNKFEGWGGEDDNLFFRLKMHKIKIIRFPYRMSRYTMMWHRPERPNSARYFTLRENRQHAGVNARDGLNSLQHVRTRVVSAPLVKHVRVLLRCDTCQSIRA